MFDNRNIWNVIFIAQSNRSHPPTSPNTVPAARDSHSWSSSHMKLERPVQCAEQQESPSNITKHCACHKNGTPKYPGKFPRTAETSCAMRGRSDHDPSMTPSVRNPPRNWGFFRLSARAFCIEKYNISRSGYRSEFHQISRLPRKVKLNFTKYCPSQCNWMCNLGATSPNVAPATESECETWMQPFFSTDSTVLWL